MITVADWLPVALLGSSILMLVVLAIRGPVRRAIGPRLGYRLWALPAVRMLLTPLPDQFAALPAATVPWTVLATGVASGLSPDPIVARWQVGGVFVMWLAGALAVFALQVVRDVRFCRHILKSATVYG